ncbi:MAG: transposase [Chloracidobacterium sp.]|nr:transposase [Chloracidobacterium sp.]
MEHVWDECQVKLNACVIRDWNKEKDCWEYIVLVTTDLGLSARQIVRHYETRPEIEQDYEQLKSGGWLLQKLTTTRYSQIVFYLLMVVLAYSLYQLFTNTQAGAKFAGKTRQAIAFEQLRTRRTHVIVYAGGYFEIFETLTFVHLVLNLPPQAQANLSHWLEEHLGQIRRE